MSRHRSSIRVLAAGFVVLAAVSAWVIWLRPVGAPTGPTPVSLGDGWVRSTPAREGFDAPVLARSAARLLDGPFNVHAILVERHGRLIYEAYRGGRDRSVYALISVRSSFGADRLHDVRSIGKSVTGLLYGIALEEGKVPDPARPLSSVFPRLTGVAAANARRIRVRDLLDMSSGLAWQEGSPGVNDELRLFWRQDLATYVLDRPMAGAPGMTFRYNGGGTALLAQLIAEGTGEAVDRYAEQRLFGPLGIHDWQWVTDRHGRPMAFNGLRLRARDLLKLGRLVQDQGRWQGRPIVPAHWIADSWAPGRATGVADFSYRGQWWAGTVVWKGRRLPWHAAFGNGGQRLFVIPDLDLCVVTMAGAYDELPTAIAVNRLIQDVVSSVVR